MIVSHKHKFIFVKTHKTATQTFLKFIKPHLGPDDVMAGDPEEINSDGVVVNEDTQINIDKPFPTGLCAKEPQQEHGNHLPWFMIKEIVGDDIWNSYTKFTIEREPYDRMLSLFYFLNPQVMMNSIVTSQEVIDDVIQKQKDNWEQYVNIPKESHPLNVFLKWMKDNTLSTIAAEDVRRYFEEWLLVQLESPVLNLTDKASYSEPASKQKEIEMYKATANKFKLNTFLNFYNSEKVCVKNGLDFMNFPYLSDKRPVVWKKFYDEFTHINGQCRFLNYGNYFDGKEIKVDHVVDFKNVGDNIGKFFNKYNIDIKCDKNLYNTATQNAHYRKNLKGKKPVDWWYNGPRGEWIHKVIKRRFYNDNMNENQINFNKITSN